MKITEITLVGSKNLGTTSSGTTSSGQPVETPQDIVVDNEILCQPDHSALAEGISQILRRKKGGSPQKGFRCTSGPRKGRIVAKPSTCFMKTNPIKSAKVRQKRLMKAKMAGKKLGMQKRSGAGTRRLKATQPKRQKATKSARAGRLQKSGGKLQKS